MPTLRPTQIEAAKQIAKASTLLLADVGAGKTATVLTAITRRSLIHGKQRTLVLGTVRICDMVWGIEVNTWLPSYSYASAAGKTPAERKRIFESNIDIVGLNYDNLVWAAKEYGSRLAELFPQLIMDESSKLENPGTKGFKALDPILPLFKWRLPMTGTPRANHLHDLWGNVYLADLGTSLGVYKQAFLQFFFVQVQRRVGVAWLPKHDAEAQIYFRAKCFNSVYRMPFEWQKPVEIDISIPLNSRVKALQGNIDAALKNDLDVTIDGTTYARGGNRVAAKMFQLSSGLIYKDDHTVDHLHSDKMNALGEIVDEAKGEPIMVVYQFDHERDAILERYPYARLLDGAATLEEWNAGKVDMLVVHPLSCGHGLNAQLNGCDIQVWFSPTTDAELYGQTIGRLNRPGNPKTIRVFRLIMQGTKDRAAYMVVAARQRGESLTLEAFE